MNHTMRSTGNWQHTLDIEVPADDIAAAADPERRQRIVEGVRAAGYRYVTLDLGGYVSGGFNV